MDKKFNDTGIPDCDWESIAKILLYEIRKFYENEENQKAYEKWKAERDKLKENNNK